MVKKGRYFRSPHIVLLFSLFLFMLLNCPQSLADFVKVQGTRFSVNGSAYRFIGFNLRGICHYGEGDVLPYSQSSDRSYTLNYTKNTIGGRVIRAFICNKYISKEEVARRLKIVLDLAQSYGVHVICCFTDYYMESNMWVKGDDNFYVNSRLGLTWIRTNHTVNYNPTVQYVVNYLKDHQAIFAWEVANELKNLDDKEAFITFMINTKNLIKGIDSNHMVATGMISARHTLLSSEQATRLFSQFDFLTNHCYDGSDLENDIATAQALNKPLIIEEAGFFYSSDRPTRISNDIQKWMGRGAAGYMQWGFKPGSMDNGDGDREVGLNYTDVDFQQVVNVYKQWAQTLASESQPTSPPNNTPTKTSTPTATKTNTPAPTKTPTITSKPCNKGDLDCNNSVTPGDALLCFQMYMEIYHPTGSEPCQVTCAADWNSDSAITPGDALCIFKQYLEQPC